MPATSREVAMRQAHTKVDKIISYLSVGMQTCTVVSSDVIDTHKDGMLFIHTDVERNR